MLLLRIIGKLVQVPYLLRHPAVPWRWKVLPYLALIYLLSPFDLIPDFSVFGLLDDVIVVGLLLTLFVNKAQRYASEYNRRRPGSIDADFTVLTEDDQEKTGGENFDGRAPNDDLRSQN